jgi:hypothetical protein
MDEIITFIIIWVVLYLVNRFTKKLKKVETGKPGQAKPQAEPATPGKPFWEASQPEYPTPPPPFAEKDYDEEDYQEIEKIEKEVESEEIITKQVQDSARVKPDRSEIDKSIKITPEEVGIPKSAPRLSLKQYIIWKEILDKPLSLRRKGNQDPNQASYKI